MVKQTWYIHNRELLLSDKSEWDVETFNDLNESQGHYAEQKNPVSEGHTMYYSFYVTFLKWRKYSDGEQIDDSQGQGMAGERRGVTVGK